MSSRLGAITLSLLMVLSVIGPAVGMSAAQTSDPGEEFVTVGEDPELAVWDRSVLPLRVDTGNAATTVNGMQTFLEGADGVDFTGNADLDKDTIAVYNDSDTLTVNFETKTGADLSQFDESEFDILAAKIEDSDEVNMPSGLEFESIQELLLEDDENVAFEFAAEGEGLNDDLSIEYDLTEGDRGSGIYVFIAVESGQFEINDGNVDVTDDLGTVYGLDLALAQQNPSSFELQNEETPAVGETLSFDVDAALDGGDGEVDHAVMVFDEETLSQTRQDIILQENPDSDLSPEDVEIEHDIKSVSGVSSVEAFNFLGTTIGERQIDGVVEFDEIISFIAEEAGEEEPGTSLVGDEILNASVTTISNADADTTVDVETSDRWQAGEYTVVHVAVGENEAQMSTSRDTIGLDPSDVFEVTDVAVDDTDIEVGDTRGATIEITNTGGAEGTQTVDVSFNGEPLETSVEDGELDDTPTELTLGPEDSQTINTEFTATETGTFDLVVETEDDTAKRSIEVGEPADFEVRVLEDDSEVDILTGQFAAITIEAENVGDVPGDLDLNVTADNGAYTSGVEIVEEDINFENVDGGEITSGFVGLSTPSHGNVDVDGQETFDVLFYDAAGEEPTSTAEADASTTVTVNEREEGSFLETAIVDIDDSEAPFPYDAIEGNTATVNVSVTERGKEPAAQDVSIFVEGDDEPLETIEVDELDDLDSTEYIEFQVSTEIGDAPELEVTVEPDTGTDTTETIDIANVTEFDINVREDRSELEVFAGQDAELRFEVENLGDLWDSKEISFEQADGSDLTFVPEDKDVSLTSGSETERSVVIETDDEITEDTEYVVEIYVDGQQKATTTLTVNAQPAEPYFDVDITNIADSDDEAPFGYDVIAGDTVEVTTTVENIGDETGTQDITLSIDGEEVKSESVEIKGGETEDVTLSYETDESDIGSLDANVSSENTTDEATIDVAQPETFEINIRSFSDTSIIAGQTASLWVEVENVGDVDATDEQVDITSQDDDPFELPLDDTINLDSGQNIYLQFDLPTDAVEDSAGEYTVTASIDDVEDSDVVTVGEPEPEFFDISIDEVRDTELAEVGNEAEVEVTIENIGSLIDSQDIELIVDGDIEDSENVDLDPEDSRTITFTYTFQEGDSADLPFTVRSENDDATGTISFNESAEFSTTIVSIDDVIEGADEFEMDVLITNTGDETESFDLNVLLNGEDAADIDVEGDTLPIELNGGESTQATTTVTNASDFDAGTLIVEAEVENEETGDIDDRSTRRVTVGNAPEFTVDITDINEPIAGDDTDGTLEVTAEITNEGDDIGTQDIDLRLDGDRVDRISDLRLSSDESESVTLERETRSTDAGDARATISTDDDSESETATIRSSATFALDVGDDDVTQDPVRGEPLQIDVTIMNTGDVTGDETVDLVIDDETVDTETVTVDGQDSEQVPLEYVPTESGELLVTADGSDDTAAGMVNILEPGSADIELRDVTDPVTTEDESFEARLRVTNVGDTDIQVQATDFTVELAGETLPFTMLVDDEAESSIDLSGGASETIILETDDDVTADPGTVDLAIEMAGVDEITGEIEVLESPEDAYFRLGNFELADDSILVGDEAQLPTGATETHVSANVTNIGDETDTQTIELRVNGETIAEEPDVTLAGDDPAHTVDFTIDQDDIPDGQTGEVTVEIASDDSDRSGTIDVREATDGELAIVDVAAPDTIVQGDSLEVNATIENIGDKTVSDRDIELEYYSGMESSATAETIAGGDTEEVSLSVDVPEEALAGQFERHFELSTGDETVGQPILVDFEDIQSGVDVAEATSGQDQVFVADDRVYSERVTISDPGIELSSTGQATIDTGDGPVFNIRDGADGVVVDGFELGGANADTAIRVRSDGVTIDDVEIDRWDTAIDSQGYQNVFIDLQITNTETGIEVGGDESFVAHNRLFDIDDVAIDIDAENVNVRTTSVLTSGTAISVNGTAFIEENEIRNNDFGITVTDVPDVPGTPVQATRNNLEANDVSIRSYLNPDNVDATQNWWGDEGGAQEGDVVGDLVDTTDPAGEPYDDADYTVDATPVSDVDYGDELSVDATITNDGDFEGRQLIGLLVDDVVVDTEGPVEIDPEDSEQVTLSVDTTQFDPDVGDIDVVVVSEDDAVGFISNVATPAEFDVNIDEIPDTVEEGETIDVDVDVENLGEQLDTQSVRLFVDGDEADSDSVELDGSESEQITLSYDTDSDDIGTLSLEVASNDATEAATVTVEEEEDDTSGTSTSRTRTPDPVDDPPEDVDVSIEETVDPEVDDDAETSTVTFSDDSDVESIVFDSPDITDPTTVRTVSEEPAETGPSPGTSASVLQISVPENAQDTSATIRTRVAQERLDELDIEAEDLRVNRFSDGEWGGLETEIVEETDERVVLEAETPGFSWFSVSAVSQPEATFDVTPAQPEVGDEITFDASNSDDRHGEITSYEWSINGEEFTGETVTYTFDDADEFDVTLTVENDAGENDSEQQTVTVTEEPVSGSESESESEPEPEPEPVEESSSLSGFAITLIVVFLGAVLAAVLWFRRQQEN